MRLVCRACRTTNRVPEGWLTGWVERTIGAGG